METFNALYAGDSYLCRSQICEKPFNFDFARLMALLSSCGCGGRTCVIAIGSTTRVLVVLACSSPSQAYGVIVEIENFSVPQSPPITHKIEFSSVTQDRVQLRYSRV